jgi:hypothetical protein
VASNPFQWCGQHGIVHGQGDPPVGQMQGPRGDGGRCVVLGGQQTGDIGARLFQGKLKPRR